MTEEKKSKNPFINMANTAKKNNNPFNNNNKQTKGINNDIEIQQESKNAEEDI